MKRAVIIAGCARERHATYCRRLKIPDERRESWLSLGPATEAWRQTTERYADKLVSQVAAMLGDCCTSVTTQVLTGNPAESLAEAARNVDLLVVGSHVRNRMERFLLGSVSHALLHRSPCSVLIVR